MTDDLIYHERVSSNRTEALFITLTLLFLLLFIWRVNVDRPDVLAVVFFCFFILFLFYSINYRTLNIRLSAKSLMLTFGVFTWSVPWDNVAECHLDEIPSLMKYGGAGIHFMLIRKRYRASFNFLEHPRVVIAFKRKVGPVRDISFSTCQPDVVLRLIQEHSTFCRDSRHRENHERHRRSVNFAEPQFPIKVAEVIAAESGARILFLNPLGLDSSYGYLDLRRYDMAK